MIGTKCTRQQDRNHICNCDCEGYERDLSFLRTELEKGAKAFLHEHAISESFRVENIRLRESLVLRCAFCGKEYPDGTPPTKHQLLAIHIAKCPSHPMRKLEAEVEQLRAITQLEHECAACSCSLSPINEVPHCEDCSPEERQEEHWRNRHEDAIAALETKDES